MLCIYKTCYLVCDGSGGESPWGSMWKLFELLFMTVEWEERSRHPRVPGVWIICWNIDPHSVAARQCVINLVYMQLFEEEIQTICKNVFWIASLEK